MNVMKRSLTLLITLCIIFLLGMISPVWSAQGDYDGYYAGSFEGDDNGLWVARIDSSLGSGFLSYSTDTGQGDWGILSFYGEKLLNGIYYADYFVSPTEINGSTVQTYIKASDDSVIGEWSNPVSTDEGLLSGDKISSTTYSGTYSGTFSGDNSGTWSMTISQSGSISGSSTSSEGSGTFDGACHPNGYVLALGEDNLSGNLFGFFGQISGSSISGSWLSEDGSSGTFKTGSSPSPNPDPTPDPTPNPGIIQVQGKWTVTDENDQRNCGEGINTVVYTLSVQQDGERVTVTKKPEGTFTGSISGNTITWSGSYPEDGGTTTILSMTVTVSDDGKTFTSQANWSWSDGDESCTGTSQGQGVRITDNSDNGGNDSGGGGGGEDSGGGGGGGGCFFQSLIIK